jgi:hypothetical protein
MGKRFLFLTGAIAAVLLCVTTTAHAAAGNNPFAHVEEVNIGTDIDWRVGNGTISKTSAADSDTHYKLSLDMNSMSLLIGSDADVESSVKSFKNFALEDVVIDGERVPLFQWCLNNQQNHSRFLQQGLKVKKNVCQNKGAEGGFTLKLNKKTFDRIKNGKRLTLTVRPFRTSIKINYDISDFDQVFAIHQMKTAAPKVAVASIAVSPAASVATRAPAMVRPVQVRMCKATAPKGYAIIRSVEYVCNDNSDKMRAERKVAAAVNKEKQHRIKVAAEKEKRRLAAIALKKKQQEDRLKAEQQKREEEKAIAESQLKSRAVLDELTKKMVGVCNKISAKGKHRCYCERFIEYAPEGIESDPSCSS